MMPGMVEAPHPMVEGMETEDYYKGRVEQGDTGAAGVRRTSGARAATGQRPSEHRDRLPSLAAVDRHGHR